MRAHARISLQIWTGAAARKILSDAPSSERRMSTNLALGGRIQRIVLFTTHRERNAKAQFELHLVQIVSVADSWMDWIVFQFPWLPPGSVCVLYVSANQIQLINPITLGTNQSFN
jgi:hypothetical protein